MDFLPLIPAPKVVVDLNEIVDIRESLQSLLLVVLNSGHRLEFHLRRYGFCFSKKQADEGFWRLASAGAAEDYIEDRGFDSYYLKISSSGISLASKTERGLFYAIITLRKLIDSYSAENFPGLEIHDWSDAEIRCDYFDLRSIHPKFERMLCNIESISEAKLNGLVIEYEDKLPIGGIFSVSNKDFTFSDAMLEELKKHCELYYIEIIPLQQTFGHLEYILKEKRFRHLMETETAVGEICPLRNGSFDVSKALVEAMAKRHPESRYLHIGCDEVWSLGSSEECRKDGRSKTAIFISYVNKIINEVCKCGKTPLFWHDMLEEAPIEELSLLDRRAIVCIWIYNGNDLISRVHDFAGKLDKLNIRYWACPAVRAWDEDDRQNYPVLSQRLNNILKWSQCISQLKIKGVINTNWAACFALAKPYGIYETSFYTIYFAAERCWNTSADADSFMERYLKFFHGYVDETGLYGKGWKNEDFYQILASLDGKLEKNGRIAHLIALLRKFELPTRRFFPLTVVLYRSKFFHSSEELGSLKNKLDSVKKTLEEVEAPLKAELSFYLEEYAVNQFIESRYFVEDLLIEKAQEIVRQYEEIAEDNNS